MVRPLVVPLVPHIAPDADVIVIDENPYEPTLTPDDEALADLAARAIEARPDLLLVAPYQWTPLDARIARSLEGVPGVALEGVPFVHPDVGVTQNWTVGVDNLVSVDADAPELSKNRKLAAAVLSKAVKLGDPRMAPTDEQLASADAVLAGAGLEADSYWIACVGHPDHAAVRNWPLENWSSLLAGWAERHDRRFLLIGASDERATSRAVIKGMGKARDHASDWFGADADDLDTLIGLIARSRGYVGRDTGPMHLSAALRKPVLAVFGAGTWPRFVPAVDPSIAVTVGVPTSGCGWDCKVDSAYAIDEVPLEMVAKAADDLEAAKLKRRTKRVAPASEALLRQIARDSLLAVREIRVRARQERGRADHVRREAKEQGAQMNDQLTRQNAEMERLKGAMRDLEKRLSTTTTERDQARVASAASEEKVKGLRERVEEAQKRATAAEQRAEQRAEQLGTARAEAARLTNVVDARATQFEELKARLADPDSPKVKQLDEKIAHLRAQVAELTRERDELRKALDATRSKEGQVASNLETARARVSRMQNELDDTLRRFERTQSEQKTLSALSRQQAKELIVVRKRLDELLASRWRKLGQRIGVAMVLPWEQERANGQKG
jgi:hypothetical protein